MSTKRAVVWLSLVVALGCRCEGDPQTGGDDKSSVSVPAPARMASPGVTDGSAVAAQGGGSPPSSSSAPPVVRGRQRLAELPISAYGHVLSVEGDTTFLLTAKAAYRFSPGGPTETREAELGQGPVLTSSGIVGWSQGAIRRLPFTGPSSPLPSAQQSLDLGKVTVQPQVLFADGQRLAWLARGDDGRFSFQAFRGHAARTLYSTGGSIESACLLGDALFFVEREVLGGWRFGRARASGKGGPPIFSPPRHGRTPSMLVPADGAIYYYDGPSFEVRRLAADLQSEETVVRDRVCSPLAVDGTNIYCSSVEGLFAIPKPGAEKGGEARLLVPGNEAQITTLAASGGRVSWLSDIGAQRAAIETMLAGDDAR